MGVASGGWVFVLTAGAWIVVHPARHRHQDRGSSCLVALGAHVCALALSDQRPCREHIFTGRWARKFSHAAGLLIKRA